MITLVEHYLLTANGGNTHAKKNQSLQLRIAYGKKRNKHERGVTSLRKQKQNNFAGGEYELYGKKLGGFEYGYR